MLNAANSISNKDIKLSERINIPSSRLRGFEKGKVGPKENSDYDIVEHSVGYTSVYSVGYSIGYIIRYIIKICICWRDRY